MTGSRRARSDRQVFVIGFDWPVVTSVFFLLWDALSFDVLFMCYYRESDILAFKRSFCVAFSVYDLSVMCRKHAATVDVV